MTRFLTLAAALLGLCVVTPSTRAGAPPPPPSLTVEFVDIGSSFAGGMTTVTASLFATVGNSSPTLVFGATFAPAPGFTGGFSPLNAAPFGNIVPQQLTSFSQLGFCESGSTTECMFPLTFSAVGPAGGLFGATATLVNGVTIIREPNFSVVAGVPEPASLALLSIALVGAGLARRKAAR